jgi:hypothetical protein
MPPWAQRFLPDEVFMAIKSQSKTQFESSDWSAAFPKSELHGIEMTCLYQLLQSTELETARRLLQWEDPLTDALHHGDLDLLRALYHAGASFDGDEQSLLEAISGRKFSVAQFLIANGSAKWLLTESQQRQIEDWLLVKDEWAIRRTIDQAFAIRKAQRAFTIVVNDFRKSLKNADRVQGLLKTMGDDSSIQRQAFHIMEEILRYRLPTKNEDVFSLLLAASSARSGSTQPRLGETALFLDEIDRWRLQIDEGDERILFDEVVQLAWGKEKCDEKAPKLNITDVKAELRAMITHMGETLGIASNSSSSVEVQPSDQRQSSGMSRTVNYASPKGRRNTSTTTVVFLAGYVCAAVLSLMLGEENTVSCNSSA